MGWGAGSEGARAVTRGLRVAVRVFGWSWAAEQVQSEGRCWESCVGPRTQGEMIYVSLSKSQGLSPLTYGEAKNGITVLVHLQISAFTHAQGHTCLPPHTPLYRHACSPPTCRGSAHTWPPPRGSSSPSPPLCPPRERRVYREGWAGQGAGGLTCTKPHRLDI